MKKTFLTFTCIVVFTLGLFLVSCQKQEAPKETVKETPAATEQQETPKETPAATEESDKGGEEKPKVGGY